MPPGSMISAAPTVAMLANTSKSHVLSTVFDQSAPTSDPTVLAMPPTIATCELTE